MQIPKVMFDSARKKALTFSLFVASIFVAKVIEAQFDKVAGSDWASNWWRAMTDYQNFIYAGMWLFLGASVAMAIDMWLRKRETAPAKVASLSFKQEPGRISEAMEATNVLHWEALQFGENVRLYILYDRPVVPHDLAVICNQDGVTWEELESSERFRVLGLRGIGDTFQILVTSVALGAKALRKSGIRKAMRFNPQA